MAVVNSVEKEVEGGGGGKKPPEPGGKNAPGQKKGLGAWVKKNKLAAGGLGIGGLILLMAHKGKGGATESGKAAEEAAALQQQRANAIEGGIVPSSAPSSSGGGEGSSGSVTPAAPAADLPQEVAPGDPGIPALAQAVEALGGDVSGLSAAQADQADGSEGGKAAETAAYERGVAKIKAQDAAKKKKPAGKKEGKDKATPSDQHGGVTVNGRHFAGATGSTLGPVIRNSNGETHRTVTIKYGGRTETLISHNGGKSWTKNAPGHTPPKRGQPVKTHTKAPAHHAPPKAKPKPKPKAKPAPAKHAAAPKRKVRRA